ncbi:MAG: DUF3857 domain-containing protein, partial [Bacteroidota bacterium]
MYRHRRIKILNRKGLEYADVSIPYYSNKNIEAVIDLKAQTLLVDDRGKVKRHEVANKEFFLNEVDEKWSERNFTFPAVEEGAIIEYRYTLATEDIMFLDAWVFQNELPTMHSQLEVEMPPYLSYSYLMGGARLANKYRNQPANDNTWSLNNIPGFRDDPYIYNYLDYTDKMQFQLVEYRTSGGYGGAQEVVEVLQDWAEVVSELNERHKYFLKRDKVATELLQQIIREEDTDLQKVKKIFYWVQGNLTWNGYYSFIHRQRVRELLNTRQ